MLHKILLKVPYEGTRIVPITHEIAFRAPAASHSRLHFSCSILAVSGAPHHAAASEAAELSETSFTSGVTAPRELTRALLLAARLRCGQCQRTELSTSQSLIHSVSENERSEIALERTVCFSNTALLVTFRRILPLLT